MKDEQTEYQRRLRQEQAIYKDVEDINVLPAIFHYWSNKYLRPMLEEIGVSSPDAFFAKYLLESARASGVAQPAFLSVGAGNCDTEVRVAKLLRDAGLSGFTIACMDINEAMLQRGQELARAEGVAEHIRPLAIDFNRWDSPVRYDGIMANQSLHHVVELEHLFRQVKAALAPRANFVISDMIGRNGHMRWPEARAQVERFWEEMPPAYRYNQQLGRQEMAFQDWDCSGEGFEGIRAQDILPLLASHFHFSVFLAFGNVVDPFTDRSFGHNFDADAAWDRYFIDRVHACDEAGLRAGTLTPTHLMAVVTSDPVATPFFSRGLDPARCQRVPTD